MKEGPDAGRMYFACPIRKFWVRGSIGTFAGILLKILTFGLLPSFTSAKEGQGACNFFQWVDTQTETTFNGPVDKRRDPVSPASVLNNDVDVNNENTHLDMEGVLDPDHMNSMDIESREMNVHLQCSDVNMSGTPECNVVVRKRKRQSDYAPVIDFSVIPSTNVRNESCVPDQAEEHRLAAQEMSRDILKVNSPNFFVTAPEETQENEDLSMDVSFAGTASVGDAVTIGLHVKGLWGQLVFSPSRCLTVPATKTFFCLDGLEEFNTQLSNLQPPCAGSPDDAQEDNLEDSIHMAFSQAALQVQRKLLCRLEFMDPLEHATMEREANIAFSALNSLGVNYGPFAEHIREFICSAKSLAEIDASICREDASERLEHEKVCRDKLSHLHAEITNELRTSREHVQSLCEEENRLKKKLLQIETQRTQYEDKAKNLEERLVKNSEEILESECRLQAATQEVDKAMKFQQQREMEQESMKKAMKNARAHLRCQ
ncbi:hypothetical protein RJ641_035517 [Dillenia turbinata]|uniref:GRF-type domain-containing protein n=1 Tax=Dillenia turbinata TaxID=194707 RepID=A0AAN8VTB6_9MAGN